MVVVTGTMMTTMVTTKSMMFHVFWKYKISNRQIRVRVGQISTLGDKHEPT